MKNRVSNDIAAAILAGGKNSRMAGSNKAFISINGTPIIQRTIELLEEIFDEVILATNTPEDFRLYKERVVITKDIIKGIGPLAGIHSALSQTSKEGVFFVACDMPFLHIDLIRKELTCFNKAGCDCLVPRIGSYIEPLHAIYKKSIKDAIQSFAKDNGNYSIRNFLKTRDVFCWDLEDNIFNRKIFKNLNTKEDLKEIGGVLCR